MNNITLDTGQNLTSLGFAFLFLKYLLPVVLVGILLIGSFVFFYWLWKKINFTGFDIDNRDTQILLIIGLIVVVALVAVLGAMG